MTRTRSLCRDGTRAAAPRRHGRARSTPPSFLPGPGHCSSTSGSLARLRRRRLQRPRGRRERCTAWSRTRRPGNVRGLGPQPIPPWRRHLSPGMGPRSARKLHGGDPGRRAPATPTGSTPPPLRLPCACPLREPLRARGLCAREPRCLMFPQRKRAAVLVLTRRKASLRGGARWRPPSCSFRHPSRGADRPRGHPRGWMRNRSRSSMSTGSRRWWPRPTTRARWRPGSEAQAAPRRAQRALSRRRCGPSSWSTWPAACKPPGRL
mmetsp:Transcript_21939/g.52422  ORF Transcript_21939/g.52422 Transcript_21939/m.52422 type:complete len:264 (-) Transcript_21939:919-1710(-)